MNIGSVFTLLCLFSCLVGHPIHASRLKLTSEVMPNELSGPREVADRVKSGRRGYTPKSDGSQLLTSQQVASRVFPQAEGKGLSKGFDVSFFRAS